VRVSRLQLKALLLLVAVGIVPVAGAMAVLLPGYGQAVRLNEQQYQLVVLKEAAAAVERHIALPQLDAVAVANALSQASSEAMRDRQEQAFGAVEALLQSRPNLDAVRFEVPAAKVSTVLHKHGAASSDVPTSTDALRREADARGVAFEITDGTRATLVVPIPATSQSAAARAKGYVTTSVYLEPLATDLRTVAEARALIGDATGMVIVDSNRRVIAGYNAPWAKRGADASHLPIWSMLPDGVPRDRPLGLHDDYEEGGVKMVGSVQTIRNIGWAMALWRPEAVALAEYYRVRKLIFGLAAAAVLVALLIGFVSTRAITGPVLRMAKQARLIGERAWDRLLPAVTRKDELGDLSRALHTMAGDLQEGEREIERQAKLRGDLSRFVSKDLVDAIVSGSHPLELGGRRQTITVLFADVVAFTPLAEGREPEQVVSMLNELFSVLTEVVFRHEGMVDKFIGDCIMGVWGAPVATEDHAARALAAAEDMMRFLEVAGEQWHDKYGVEVRLAIGVNSGDAIVGNIGSDKRMEYTVVGDTVNVAARLETIAAPNQVLVGESTAERARDEFDLRLLGERKLTGRKAEIRVYELETS